MVSLRRWAAAAVLVSLSPPLSADPDTDRALASLKAVSREGQGNNSAAAAWKAVVGKGAAALVPTLQAMKGSDPTAANWLRTAVDAIAENEAAAGRKLPSDVLTGFVSDTANAPAARRIAFELLRKDDAAGADKLLAGFLDDPSLELRRDAIAQGIKEAEGAKEGGDTGRFRRLFQSARDKDQVEALAKRLEKAGEKVSLTEHLGFVTHWHLIGPFDSTGGSGFGKPYPPETNTDPKAKLPGKDGDLAWTPAVSADRYGMIDLNKSLGKHKDAAAYAVAFITAGPDAAGKPVEVRAGSQNAVQIFLNGQKLFAREEYHHGTRMDQHVARGTLKPGTNVLLLKVCQNAQTESWAQVWGFQCRLCDATGGALPLRQTVPGDAPQDIKLGYAPVVDPPKEGKK